MPLKAILNTVDDLSDELKKAYVEKDGKFILDVSPVDGFSLEDVSGLKTSLAKERQSVAEKDRLLESFSGLDPEKSKAALSKVEEMKDWKADDVVQATIKAREDQLVEKQTREIGERDDTIGSLSKQLDFHVRTSVATTSITAQGGSVELMLPHVLSQTNIADVKGNRITQIVDKDGTPRISTASGSQADMSMDELVSEMKANPTYAPCFPGSGASGSGASGSGAVGGGNGSPKEILSSDQDTIDANVTGIANGDCVVVDG